MRACGRRWARLEPARNPVVRARRSAHLRIAQKSLVTTVQLCSYEGLILDEGQGLDAGGLAAGPRSGGSTPGEGRRAEGPLAHPSAPGSRSDPSVQRLGNRPAQDMAYQESGEPHVDLLSGPKARGQDGHRRFCPLVHARYLLSQFCPVQPCNDGLMLWALIWAGAV